MDDDLDASETAVGAHLLWEASSNDFVYTVALSADLTYCIYGGTNKAVIVLDIHTSCIGVRASNLRPSSFAVARC